MLFKKVYLTVLFIMVFFLTITATEFHGVCVGINDYPGTDNDLDYCINDAQELRNALINFHNWSSGNISLLTDSNADESDIINAINNMPRTTGTNTSFFSPKSGKSAKKHYSPVGMKNSRFNRDNFEQVNSTDNQNFTNFQLKLKL